MRKLLAVVFLAWALSAGAQEIRTPLGTHGDWRVYSHPAGTFVAETKNESGAVFGLVCHISTQVCYWAIVSNSTCAVDAEYPVLVNSASGSSMTSGRCFSETSKFTLTLDNFDALELAASSGARIGFAVPLESGMFYVTRFSLHGAIAAMRSTKALTVQAGRDRTGDLLL